MLKLAMSLTFNVSSNLNFPSVYSQLPSLGTNDKYSKPSWLVSVTNTSSNAESPILVTLIVKVTLSPMLTTLSIVIFSIFNLRISTVVVLLAETFLT